MNKVLFKDFLVEIKKTKMRFLAIFAIVCLGVAIYSGIGAVADDMRYSIDKYYDQYNLFDYHMLGSLGIDDKDVEVFKNLDIVDNIFPTYSKEVLININGKSNVFRLEAYDFKKDVLNDESQINRFKLVEGKLPSKDDECLIEKGKVNLFDNLKIGDYLNFSLNKNDKLDDFLNIKGCEISGFVESPYYLSYQKGPSKLGDGSLYSYLYVDKNAFNLKVYTDLYLTLKNAKKYNSYKKEYDNLISSKDDILQAIGEKRANIRYESIYKEINDKYNEGLKKYQESKNEYDSKIAYGEKKLKNAEKEYDISEKKYSEGYKKFIDTIKKKQDEIDKNEKTINENETKLNKKYDDVYLKTKDILSKTKNEVNELRKKSENLHDTTSDIINSITINKQIYDNSLNVILDFNKKYFSQNFNDNDKNILMKSIDDYIFSSEKLINLQNEENTNKLYENFKNDNELFIKEELYYNFEKQIDFLEHYKDSEILKFKEEIRDFLAENKTKYETSYKQYENEKNILNVYPNKIIRLNEEEKTINEHLSNLENYNKDIKDKISSLISLDKNIFEGNFEDKNLIKNLIDEIYILKSKINNINTNTEIKEYLDAKKNISISEIKASIYKQLNDENAVSLINYKIEFLEGRNKLNEGRKLLNAEKNQKEKEFSDIKQKLIEAKNKLIENKNKFELEKKDGKRKLDDANDELVKAKNKIENLDKTKWYSLNRNKHYSFVDFKQTANRMEAISKIFPIFFFLVSALVCSTTMTRLVDEQRMQIGTLKALGYSKFSISLKYILYAFSASFFGSILGLLIGMSILPLIIYNTWKMMYVMPNMSYDLQPYLILTSISLSVFITIFVTYLSVNSSLKEKPSILMRPKVSKAGKKLLIEKINFLWSKISFISKVTLRNLFRYKKRFFMTVFGIMGTTALLVAGFGIKDSISSIVDRQFDKIFKYDGMINFKSDISFKEYEDISSKLNDMSDVDKSLKLYIFNGTIKNEYGENSVHVGVYDDYEKLNEFISLHDRVSNKRLNESDEGIFISEKTAINLGLSVGSKVFLIDNNDISKEVFVKGIFENYLNHYVYLKKDYFENTFGLKLKQNAVYLSIKNNDENKQSKIVDEFNKYKEIDSINFHLWLQNNFKKMVEGLNVIVLVLVICAGMLSFVVLINLTNVNISERTREIATLKVLGFNKKEVSRYIYRENLILTFIGSIFGLFLGKFLHLFIMRSVELENIMFGRNIKISSYLMSFILTFVFTCLVNILLKKKVKKIEMVESLKSVE